MELKYVKLDDVVSQCIGVGDGRLILPTNSVMAMYLANSPWCESNPRQEDAQITEDVDYELIEPKQLPASDSPALKP
jgi:hypothetical protein